MNKFKDIQYERPDFEAAKKDVETFMEAFDKAQSYQQARELFLQYVKSTEHLGTMYTVASIRNTIDTTDAFYEGEMNLFFEKMPVLQLSFTEASNHILASPYKDDFAKEFGQDFVLSMEAQQKLNAECVVADQTEEARLKQEYCKITAQAKAKFRGEECNFYGLSKHMQSPDRAERKEAYEAWANLYASIADSLDNVFDKLVALRCGMAKKLGFDNYVDMAYLINGHYYYNAQDVAAFRKQVVDVVVPAVQELYARQQKHIGVDKLHCYDEHLIYNEGNATPIGNRQYLVNAAQEMYRELSKETGEFFDFMVEHELFDLETRPGKHMGGYCTFLEEYKAPFIFSNFNGTSADVDVLTHEAGHAFQAYTSAKYVTLSSQIWSSNEISEIHSMTMEHFAYPYMEKFFGDAADKYRYAHLSEALKSVPYLCLVDHFQHEVFAHPEVGAKGYRAIWKKLEKVYMPWRDYDGNAFLEGGGFWMQKQHIFLYPFYYVDYAMAQMGAFELYERSLTNKKQAWADYYALCCSGGSKPYFDTLKVGNISNPFAPDTVKKVTAGIIARLLSAKY